MFAKTVILGNGLAGSIAKSLIKDALVVSSDVSQAKARFSLGPRFIWDDSNTRSFLKLLNIAFTKKTVKVGYLYNKSITSSVSSDMGKNYSIKTFRDSDDQLMSESRTEFDVLDADLSSLFSYDFTNDTITNISYDGDVYHLLSKSRESYTCKNLISTINMNEFLRAAQLRPRLPHLSTMFLKYRENSNFITDKAFVYCCDDDNLTRITKIDDTTFVLEFSVDETVDYTTKSMDFDPEKILDRYYLECSHFRSKDLSEFISNMLINNLSLNSRLFLLGRYAQWRRTIKMGAIVAQALKIREVVSNGRN